METEFCLKNLNHALKTATPTIHNSDQGVQFTDKKYIRILAEKKINISMDGKGRCMDNIFTERLWRTVKYENVFLSSYRNLLETRKGLHAYFLFYNEKRRHQALDYRTPAEVYFDKKKIKGRKDRKKLLKH
jgi:putative transposase